MSADGRYYSQSDEERVILEACADIKHGRFLDIGACDPKWLSNTRALYERGWRGVMVEPSPGHVRDLVQEYGQVDGMDIVCALVATLPGALVPIRVSDDAISTSEAATIEKWEATRRAAWYGRMWITTVSVSGLLARFGRFDFVSIDTEGTSVEIFRDLLACATPRLICVEHDNEIDVCNALIQAHGYELLYRNGENLIYVLP